MGDRVSDPKTQQIVRDMRDARVQASWPEYHRLRRLLRDRLQVSLKEAGRVERSALPNGQLPTRATERT